MKVAVLAVEAERRRYETALFLATERRVYPTRRRTDIFGTADVIVAGQLAGGALGISVLDFKYGQNVAVMADSPQLAIYLLGAALLVGEPFSEFRSVIIQPRLQFGHRDKVCSFDRSIKEMVSFSRQLMVAASATDDPNAQPVAGSHCKWCKAKDVCPAFKRKDKAQSASAFDFAFK